MAPPAVTCMACNVLVPGAERTDHYKSDLHRVNLQRKVAGISPLTLADFLQRAEVARREDAAKLGRRGPRLCAVCSKRFSSESALSNHIASKRHRDTVRAFAPHMSLEAAALGPISSPRLSSVSGAALSPVGSDAENADDDAVSDGVTVEEEMDMEQRIAEAVPFAPTECVFDGHKSETIDENVKHMRGFGFFLPFAEALRDLEGLLEYLGQKVGIGYACIECDRSFHSVPAAQQHMVDKQHCRMVGNEEVWFEEYAAFYEFAGEGGSGSDTEGWEEVEGDEAAVVEDEIRQKQSDNQVATVGDESSVVQASAAGDGYDESQKEEVALVIGNKVIGHRSLQRYYRQNIHRQDTRDAVVINKLANEFRMMGWQGKKKMPAEVRTARMRTFQKNKKNLEIGVRNYFTRKASVRVPLATFNSGYRP